MEQFSNGAFNVGTFEIIVPNFPRVGLQVGNQDRIAVTSVFKQGELGRFFRIDGQGPSNGDEAMLFFPFLRSVTKFGDAPAELEVFEAGLFAAIR